MRRRVTPTGSEQCYETPGNTAIGGGGGNAGGNAAVEIDAETAELLALWDALDDAGRSELMDVARTLSKASSAAYGP